jgi:hypothetical protein
MTASLAFAAFDNCCETSEAPRRHMPQVGDTSIRTLTLPVSALNAVRTTTGELPSTWYDLAAPNCEHAVTPRSAREVAMRKERFIVLIPARNWE